MLTATEFIDVDFTDSEAEKQRLSRLISTLPDEPQSVRTELAEEFLRITEDSNEPFARRIQAVSMLAYQSHRLGIRGLTWIARALCGLLERERTRLVVENSGNALGVADSPIPKLAGHDRLWIGHLIAGASFIDWESAEPTVKGFIKSLANEDDANRFREVVEAAKQPGAEGP